MFVYRIVKSKNRTADLSGIGAFQFGGRWNSKGTYMLYTSANSSLAMLENLVHFEASDIPPNLFLIELKVADDAPIFNVSEKEYPLNWKSPDNPANKFAGDQWMRAAKYVGIKVKSAVNELEFNYLFNPLFPGFRKLVRIQDVREIILDNRLKK